MDTKHGRICTLVYLPKFTPGRTYTSRVEVCDTRCSPLDRTFWACPGPMVPAAAVDAPPDDAGIVVLQALTSASAAHVPSSQEVGRETSCFFMGFPCCPPHRTGRWIISRPAIWERDDGTSCCDAILTSGTRPGAPECR